MQPLSTAFVLSLTASLAAATFQLTQQSTITPIYNQKDSRRNVSFVDIKDSIEKMQSDEGNILSFTETTNNIDNNNELTMFTDQQFPTISTESTECQESSFESMINFTQYNFPGKCLRVVNFIRLYSLLV